MPNISRPSILESPVPMLRCLRAAINLDLTITGAFQNNRLVFKVYDIAPTDVFLAALVGLGKGTVEDEFMVTSDSDFMKMGLTIQPVDGCLDLA